MMRNKIFAILMLLMLPLTLLAAKVDYRDNYNYKRAMEFWRKDDAKCMEWLLKEISECPKNGFAHYRLSALYRKEREFGKALTEANQGVELLKKEKEWNAYALLERASVYTALTDTVAAIADLTRAIEIEPKESDFREERGDLYFELKRYEEAEQDYRKYIELDPGEAYGYMSLGRIAMEREDYDEAIRQFTYCTKLSVSYATAYSFRAEAYSKQGKWRESVDDVITALQYSNSDRKGLKLAETLADSAYQLFNIKLKAQYRKDPTNAYWPLVLADVCNRKEHYADGLKYNQDAFSISGHPSVAAQVANSHVMLGQYEKAVEMMDRACEIDTTDINLVYNRAQIKEEAGMYEAALVDYDRYIADNATDARGYESKAGCLDRMNRIDEALEVLEIALAHNDKSPQSNLLEGKLLQLKGDKASAETFLREAIALDKDSRSQVHAMYAYHYLQQYDSLEALQTRLVERDAASPNNGNLYNIACLYALRGDTLQALDYLRRSLEAGFVSFNHARKDRDFGALLQDNRFLDLIAEYEARFNEKQGIQPVTPDTDAQMEGNESEIPYTKEGGVTKVKCAINDLPLYFIFDTGASDVTMSSVEASFMFKNGYLSARDITGKEHYQTATGEISEGTTILLRKVTFGDVTLTNVKASVVASQNAPLLLGQSVLARLGHIEIDNTKKVIRIKK